MFHKQWQIIETCVYLCMCMYLYTQIKLEYAQPIPLLYVENHLIFIALIFLLNHNRNATNQIVSNFARNYNTVSRTVYTTVRHCVRSDERGGK